jgi:hypothetical protein
MSNSPLDAGIPLLTEIIDPPAGHTVNRPPANPEPASPEPPAAFSPAVLDDAAWDRMELEVRERVLQQLLERVDFVLEQRVRDSLADVLQTAVEQLATDIKGGLHHSLRELVTRTVAEEISKLQADEK